MTRVYNFPSFPISGQVFYVPGAETDGGITAGGARISLPEPGGFGMLNIQPSLQVREWEYPISSWLMSKNNGQILKVRLAPTPQVSTALLIRGASGVPWENNVLWSNLQNWQGDISVVFATSALEGSTTVKIDLADFGEILRAGHVIGHKNSTYLIDEIEYDDNYLATITVKPFFRSAIAIGDTAYLRPYFTGQISNPSEIVKMYEASENGTIQLPRIILSEVIL